MGGNEFAKELEKLIMRAGGKAFVEPTDSETPTIYGEITLGGEEYAVQFAKDIK